MINKYLKESYLMKIEMKMFNSIWSRSIRLNSEMSVTFYDGCKIQAWDNHHDNTDFSVELTHYKNLRKFTRAYREYKKQLYLIVDGKF